MIIIVFKSALLISFRIFMVPKKWNFAVGLLLNILLVISTGSWAIDALMKGTQNLSACFILIINIICSSLWIFQRGAVRNHALARLSIGGFRIRSVENTNYQLFTTVESQRNKLLIYEKRDTLSPTEIVDVLALADGFVGTLNNIEAQSV